MTSAAATTEPIRLILMPSGRQGRVAAGTTLLEAARSLGVELESICGGRQTCGKCQVEVEEGRFAKHGIVSSASHLTPVEPREAEYWQSAGPSGRRLACAGRLQGDLLVTVPEESQARKQVIAKAATERTIEVRPSVRQVYVECEQAELDDRRGDWERLQVALRQQWGVQADQIDLEALRGLQPSLKAGRHCLTVSLWKDREVLEVRPGYAEGACGLAVDIGSTTLAAHLCDLRTGQLLASQAAMNPQVRFGEDLMSRVSYGMLEKEGVGRMQRAVLEALDALALKACASAGRSSSEILDVVIVGNSVMHHLLLGIDPVELGGAPFALACSGRLELKARELGLSAPHSAARVYIPPCIAGQNGADNVAVLLAEAPHRQDEVMLVVDVGTNAELVLGNREQLWAASCPTGPAFEGAQITHGQRAAPGAIERVRISARDLEPRFRTIGFPDWIRPGDCPEQTATGICGSGIIEAVAEMFLAGILDRQGRFAEEAGQRSSRVRFRERAGEYVLATADQTSSGTEIVIRQTDVRAIQLAKAALYAGVKLLLGRSPWDRIDRIVLAGAFGSYLSPWHAMVLGMIPDCDPGRIAAVGNAAGDGARLALLDRRQREEAEQLVSRIEYVSLAVEPGFQDQFVAAMALPHALDAFPHLEGRLPAAGPLRQRRRSRSGKQTDQRD